MMNEKNTLDSSPVKTKFIAISDEIKELLKQVSDPQPKILESDGKNSSPFVPEKMGIDVDSKNSFINGWVSSSGVGSLSMGDDNIFSSRNLKGKEDISDEDIHLVKASVQRLRQQTEELEKIRRENLLNEKRLQRSQLELTFAQDKLKESQQITQQCWALQDELSQARKELTDTNGKIKGLEDKIKEIEQQGKETEMVVQKKNDEIKLLMSELNKRNQKMRKQKDKCNRAISKAKAAEVHWRELAFSYKMQLHNIDVSPTQQMSDDPSADKKMHAYFIDLKKKYGMITTLTEEQAKDIKKKEKELKEMAKYQLQANSEIETLQQKNALLKQELQQNIGADSQKNADFCVQQKMKPSPHFKHSKSLLSPPHEASRKTRNRSTQVEFVPFIENDPSVMLVKQLQNENKALQKKVCYLKKRILSERNGLKNFFKERMELLSQFCSAENELTEMLQKNKPAKVLRNSTCANLKKKKVKNRKALQSH